MRYECLAKTPEERAYCHGGDGCCIYRQPDTVPSFDKGGHKARSLVASPVHEEHWRKERQKEQLTRAKQ